MLHVDRSALTRDSRPLGVCAGGPEAVASVGAALAAAQIGVFQIDTQSGLSTWDSVTGEILGRGAVAQTEPTMLPVHPDDRAEVARRIALNVRGIGERDVDVRIVRPNGEIRWVRSTTRPPLGREGEHRWLTGVVTDITDRKMAELALVESQRQLSTLIDNLPGIAYRCSVEIPWRMSYISEGIEALTGYPAGDFTEGGLAWASLVHPDDTVIDGEVATGIAEKRMFSVVYRIFHRDGSIRWVREQGRAIYDAEGEPVFLEGFIGDITEQKQAEAEMRATSERLASVLEGTLDCVYSMDRDFRITYLNENARRQFAKPNLIGRRIREVMPGSEASQFADCYRRVMETRRSESIEAYFPPDNAWFEAHVTPSEDGITIFYRDITDRKAAEEALKESTSRALSILDSVPHLIWSADAEGRLQYLSNQWQAHSDAGPTDYLNGGWFEAVHPDDRDRVIAAWQESVATGDPYEVELRFLSDKGDYVWLLIRAVAKRSEAGEILCWYGTCTDIHERVLAKQSLAKTQAFLERLIAASPDNIMLLDREGRLRFANEAAERSLGVRIGEPMAGRQWAGLVTRAGRAAAAGAIAEALAGRPGRFTAELALPGQPRKWWDVSVTAVREEGAEESDLLVVSRDVTVQKEAEERAQWSANHDFLTKLPNRHRLQQRLDELLADPAAMKKGFALLLLDVDQFKAVNDNLGHDAGDALLCAIAERLTSAARDDIVARLGGDEFAILLEDVAEPEQLSAAVERMMRQLAEPCAYQGKLIDCQASIGASIYPEHGREKAELLKHADIALYSAKATGRGCWKLYDPQLRAEMQKRQSMVGLARTALTDDLIVPHYQPKVDMRSGAVAGFEALLRWDHAERGVQSPATISAAFEDLTLATEISDRMIARVLADMSGWLDRGVAFGSVAINAAAAEFRRGDFAERLLERLHRCGIPPCLLQLEVTETVFLGRGAEHVERVLQTLSAAGLRIALDDFGTGYASLSHLKQFPVDLIKIDRSFVSGLQSDVDDRVIVDAVIRLGHSLGLDVVAEGIETAEQRDALLALGCAYGQGWLFGRPVPAASLAAIVEAIAADAARKAA
ncbi:MAG: EAL domain-containing protein [Allosphingosinicella sp.]